MKSGIHLLDLADEHLDKVDEPILVILKGHLLVEQALYEIVNDSVSEPKFIQYANLRFHQLMNLARAIYPYFGLKENDDSAKVWEAISALNKIRNISAHSLDHGDIKNHLKALFILSPTAPTDLADKDMLAPISQSIGFITGALSLISLKKSDKFKANDPS